MISTEAARFEMTSEQKTQRKTVDRGAALLKFTLELLKGHPEGLRPRDIFREIEAKEPLDGFDKEPMKGSGLPRWRAALHFSSVAASKAGYLIKTDSGWVITDEGRKVTAATVDELKRLVRVRYRKWRWGERKVTPESIADEGEEQDETEGTSVLLDDSKQKARAEIDAYLDQLTAYDFQELVAALIEGMGYTTRYVSPPGPDGGTDALAYVDPLGAQTPHIRVQVKHKRPRGAKKSPRFVESFALIGKSVSLFRRAVSLVMLNGNPRRARFTSN